MAEQEHLIKEIKVLSDSIRKKNRRLKMGISQREDFLESTFKPVLQPLQEISKKLNNAVVKEADLLLPVKKGEETIALNMVDDDKYAEEEEEENEDEDEVVEEEEEDEEVSEPMEESNLTVLGRDIASHGELYKKYVLKLLHGTLVNKRHHVYGARLEKNGLMIGNKELQVDESDNVLVGGKTYPGTTGLFELIFKKLPVKYTSQDLKWFKDITQTTNLHKKQYTASKPIHRNSTKKYKDIIAKLFPVKASGSGISYKDTKETNVIYYNNVNKLVERLKLLKEAQIAGHNGLHNEVAALTGELRQRGYID